MEYRPIRKLTDEVIGQIAAGEVVERPASAVKELVENSIDAGATAVTVELRDGGVGSIRVSDNGRGIPAGQMRMAFERHATSKLTTAEDLFDVHTLGFRGEALASIAAVAKVTCTSRTADAEFGVRAQVDGGTVGELTEAASPVGTTVVVRELFYNAPVRLKFLKKPAAEAGLVSDYLMRLILSRPDVAFRFVNQGKTVYRSVGDGTLESALYCIYGREALGDMRPVRGARYGVLLEGYVGVGELARGNRSQQSFFINGRYFRDDGVSKALENGCEGYVMIGRYPVCALSLTLPYRQVDVNVHPNKLEIRFQDPDSVAKAVSELTREALRTLTVEDRLLGLSQPVTLPGEASVEVVRLRPSGDTEPGAMREPSDKPANQAKNEPGTEENPQTVQLEQSQAPKGADPAQERQQGSAETVSAFQNIQSRETAFEAGTALRDRPIPTLRETAAIRIPTIRREAGAEETVIGWRTESRDAPDHGEELSLPIAEQGEAKSAVTEGRGERWPDLSQPAGFLSMNGTQPVKPGQPIPTASNEPFRLTANPGAAAQPLASQGPGSTFVQQRMTQPEKEPPELRFLGAVFRTYLLFEAGERLLMVDQHAAHERVLYDRFMARYQGQRVSQQLLSPQLLRFTARDVALLGEMAEALLEAGFDLEPFDATSVAVRAVPVILGENEPVRDFLVDALDESQAGRGKLTRDRLRRRVAQLACKHAIKAGDQLTEADVRALLVQMLETGAQPTCPHGRPIVCEWSRRDLEKRFKRIQ